MITASIDQWRRYAVGRACERAFTFLEGLNGDTEEADLIPIEGEDIFARIMSYPTRTPDKAVLEAHDAYVDIQMSLVNSEGIDWYPRASLTVDTPYDAEKDVVFFQKNATPAARVVNLPGQFTVLFPEDAHMPQLITGADPETVKKVVVKLRASLWGQ